MKKCPYCAEDIQDEAILCRYCGSRLDVDKNVVLPPITEGKYKGERIDTQVERIDENEQNIRVEEVRKTGTNWLIALLLGVLFAGLAAIPNIFSFFDLSDQIVTGQLSPLIIKSWKQNFILHFITNSLFWTLFWALIIWIWKKNKLMAITTIIMAVMIIFLLSQSFFFIDKTAVINTPPRIAITPSPKHTDLPTIPAPIIESIREECARKYGTPVPPSDIEGTPFQLTQNAICQMGKMLEYWDLIEE